MSPKEALIAEIQKSRNAISRDYSGVRKELQFQNHLRRWIGRSPLAWTGGAAMLGFILSGPKTKTKVITKTVPGAAKGKSDVAEAAKPLGFLGIVLGILRFIAPLARPVLTAYAARRFGDFAEKLR